jgi:ATP-dependent Clp protease ATP-binding subunit ClpA
MFNRYTDECKRAIFFAQQTALRGSAAAIDSNQLLLGILTEASSRANSIFRLCELLPAEATQQSALGKQQLVKGTIPLTADGKRVVAYTAREASRIRDYWIDTEHLVLGILRDGDNAAAVRLRSVGLDLETSRQRVVESKSSRPPMPNPALFWVRRRPIGFALVVAFILGIGMALTLLGVGRVGIVFTIALLAMVQVFKSLARSGSPK